MRPLEFNAVMGRTQDISTIKQSEDVKPLAEQQVITQSNIKAADAKQEQVYQKNENDMDSQYDASKEGAGAQYFESGQKKRKTGKL